MQRNPLLVAKLPRAKGEAPVLAVPNSNYATSASFGRFGLQAWAN